MPDQTNERSAKLEASPWLRIAALGLLVVSSLCCFSVVSLGGLFLLLRQYDSVQILDNDSDGQEPGIVVLLPTVVETEDVSPDSSTSTPGSSQDLGDLTGNQIDNEAGNPTLPPTNSVPEHLMRIKPPEDIDQQPLSSDAHVTLETFWSTDFPARDYYEVANRLAKTGVDSRTVDTDPPNIGEVRYFWTDSGSINAILLGQSEHANFWFDQTMQVDSDEITEVLDQFENEQYQILTDLLGTEWRPGIDNDPRFSVLHLAEFNDSAELGFFDSGDEYPRTLVETSNEQEIVYLNMDQLELGSDIYFATLIHELQHLIQWNNDPNETAWLNEGLSQLVELILGFNTVDTIRDYLSSPGIQLNSWSYEDDDAVYAHYGAAYLFLVYLWEQLGTQAISDLAQHPANGMASVKAVLNSELSGVEMPDLMGNWALANYLDDESFGDEFQYDSLDIGRPDHHEQVTKLPSESVYNLDQFATHYVKLDVSDRVTIGFAGDVSVPIIDARPHSGQKMWLAPSINELDAQLDGTFDLSGLSNASLEFWAWYDLEDEYDFGYLSVSADDGLTWDLLAPDHAAPGQYGPGFSGRSSDQPDHVQGWIFESISLNRYLGNEIIIRFESITDSAISGAGMAIDDISIPELDFHDNVESGQQNWTGSGFIISGWRLPQEWVLNLIHQEPTKITPLPLSDNNQGSWNVELNRGGVLVISALAPQTSARASYWLSITPTQDP